MNTEAHRSDKALKFNPDCFMSNMLIIRGTQWDSKQSLDAKIKVNFKMHIVRSGRNATTSRCGMICKGDLEILCSDSVKFSAYVIFGALVFFELPLDLLPLIGGLIGINATMGN